GGADGALEVRQGERGRAIQTTHAAYLGPRRAAMALPITMSRPTAKMSVPMTLTCGGRPTRVEPQIHSGKVVVVPEVKFVMTKSSMERAKASMKPESTAGKMTGNVTRQNAVHGPAPRSRAASSMNGSRVSTRARTTTATNEIENITCEIRIVTMPRPIPALTKNESSAAPVTSSGEEMVANMMKLVVPSPRNR